MSRPSKGKVNLIIRLAARHLIFPVDDRRARRFVPQFCWAKNLQTPGVKNSQLRPRPVQFPLDIVFKFSDIIKADGLTEHLGGERKRREKKLEEKCSVRVRIKKSLEIISSDVCVSLAVDLSCCRSDRNVNCVKVTHERTVTFALARKHEGLLSEFAQTKFSNYIEGEKSRS